MVIGYTNYFEVIVTLDPISEYSPTISTHDSRSIDHAETAASLSLVMQEIPVDFRVRFGAPVVRHTVRESASFKSKGKKRFCAIPSVARQPTDVRNTSVPRSWLSGLAM